LELDLQTKGLMIPNRIPSGDVRVSYRSCCDSDVIGLKCNNVIQNGSSWMHPNDAHFYYDDRPSKNGPLQAPGLIVAVAGPTDLIILMEDNESDFFKP
jgi:hypothetical protein